MESGADAARPRLSAQLLAEEAGVEVDYVQALVGAGFLTPDDEGLHAPKDLRQIRLAQALAEGGLELDDLAWVIHERGLPLHRVAEMWTVPESSGRTFAEFAESLGDRAAVLPAVYAAFGLGAPSPETVMRRDEEAAITGFLEVWGMVDDSPETFVRAARIVGDGVRRIDAATTDLFGELGGAPPSQLRKGVSLEDAQRPSRLLGPAVEQALVWLHARHSEHEVFERIVASIEETVTAAGRKERRGLEPPAIAFVDLTGYTGLTAVAGDEQAAHAATSLHALALEAAGAHGGRVVKLLGDGVLLRYPSTDTAVASVARLMERIGEAGLPPAHAGIAAGPIVTRDGDVYGHTVNLASRIASHASEAELLLPAECVDGARAAGFECEDAGEATLRGLTEPMRLARVLVAHASG